MSASICILEEIVDLINEIKNLASERDYRFSKFQAVYENSKFKSYLSQIFDKALRKKCLYLKLFWCVFSRIWIEYVEILRIFLNSVRIRKNTDQKSSEYGHFSRSES